MTESSDPPVEAPTELREPTGSIAVPPIEPTLKAAERLEFTMQKLSQDIGQLRMYGERNRTMIRAMYAFFAVVFMLLVATGLTGIQTKRVSDRAADATSAAKIAQQTQVTSCLAGNESRKVLRDLFGYVLDQSLADPKKTRAERKEISDFRTAVNEKFTERDCTEPEEQPLQQQ